MSMVLCDYEYLAKITLGKALVAWEDVVAFDTARIAPLVPSKRPTMKK